MLDLMCDFFLVIFMSPALMMYSTVSGNQGCTHIGNSGSMSDSILMHESTSLTPNVLGAHPMTVVMIPNYSSPPFLMLVYSTQLLISELTPCMTSPLWLLKYVVLPAG